MAGDWLKIDKSLPEKPEVWEIAGILNIDPDAVVGKLIRVFSWFDEHTENGNAPSVTEKLLDRLVGVTGFTNALQLSGWLVAKGDEIALRNFDRHNGKTAKTRALGQVRQEKHRNAPSVTKTSLEKRREESNTTTRPTVEMVAAYVETRDIKINPQSFIDYYQANGWKVGRNSMKDWKAAVRTWEKRERKNGNAQNTVVGFTDTRRLSGAERTRLARQAAYERELAERSSDMGRVEPD